MLTTWTMALIAFSLSTSLMALAIAIGKTSSKQREKLTPFECGFDPLNKARMPFSLRFFLVTILFLIFDVEIVILLPLSTALYNLYLPVSLPLILAILLILILGLYHEWNQGALNWVK